MDNNFTEQDLAAPPILGPEYYVSQRLAEAMLEKVRVEHLEPVVKMVADKIQDKLWDDVRDWLLQDTEQNVAGAVRDMVGQTIDALLTGNTWAMARYPYADYTRGAAIRAAVCHHGGDTLMARRVRDLEEELSKKNETIKHLTRSGY